MNDMQFSLELTYENGLAFAADFHEPGIPKLLIDEPPPLGSGRGPNPARLLAAAVGDCLGASLLFCLHKSKIDVRGMRVFVDGSLVRNEKGRMRIGGLKVRLVPDVAPSDQDRMGRCLDLYEDYCIVTESVRHGIDVGVEVDAPAEAAVAE